MQLAAALICVGALSSCGPELADATDAGGSVSHANGIDNQDAAFKLAERHCEKFGKVARVTSPDPFAVTMIFACAKP